MRHGKRQARRQQGGFTYFVMLFALTVFGLGLAALGETWSHASQRDKEAELILVGQAYVQAIANYYQHSPTTPKAYPTRLEQLVEDRRFVGIERHLRRLYGDPVSGRAEWGTVTAPDGGIAGVYSLSEKQVLRQQALKLRNAEPVGGARYVDWKFVYQPRP